MKFGKSLNSQIEETLPEWRDKFLSYKDLKKRLKLIAGRGERAIKRRRLEDRTVEAVEMTMEEPDFIRRLEAELKKVNAFFERMEEEYVIRSEKLEKRVARAKEREEELMGVMKELVDFHGEMVLLENYSALNYTGLVKILKKYDKRTGALIRQSFIEKVLQQPFFTTDVLYLLINKCASMLDSLLHSSSSSSHDHPHPPPPMGVVPEHMEEIEHMESLFLKRTISALKALRKIRSGSSTVSYFSLPPLSPVTEAAIGHSGLAESWIKVPVLQQAAK
ncbi:SPX domain-containing protein 2 [Acorus gramineus]|uniref:SPX domain-containing protein 2 n=1 Tax=Acorus gramineus TaxID=55184 RepID=A0AAV9AJB2_ACOGR|nr:SPX domain-containing protein 2 [Acorus gramineus]KAK1264433.1 SPX domain-containing protein 2 [Acorus gramineus]